MRGFTPFGRENAALSWRFDDNWLYLFWFSTGDRETRRESRTGLYGGTVMPHSFRKIVVNSFEV